MHQLIFIVLGITGVVLMIVFIYMNRLPKPTPQMILLHLDQFEWRHESKIASSLDKCNGKMNHSETSDRLHQLKIGGLAETTAKPLPSEEEVAATFVTHYRLTAKGVERVNEMRSVVAA